LAFPKLQTLSSVGSALDTLVSVVESSEVLMEKNPSGLHLVVDRLIVDRLLRDHFDIDHTSGIFKFFMYQTLSSEDHSMHNNNPHVSAALHGARSDAICLQ
jgi:hypothetical protein